jgi:hypothetical protein
MLLGEQIEKLEVVGARSTRRSDEKYITVFIGKPEEKRSLG